MPFLRAQLSSLLLPIALGCGNAPPSGNQGNSEVESAVLQTFDSLMVAIRTLNVDRMLSFYSTDSSIVRALDGRLIAGRSAVERDFREGFAAVRAMDRLNVLTHHITVLSAQSAVLTTELDEAFTDTAGRVAAVRATWTSVWSLQANHWRIAQDAAVHVPSTP